MSKQPLSELMASIQAPKTTRTDTPWRVNRALAARKFADAYLAALSDGHLGNAHIVAYRAIRAHAHGGGFQSRRTARAVERWLKDRLVCEFIAEPLRAEMQRVRVDLRRLCERITEDMDATLEPFFDTNEVGEVIGMRIQPSRLTAAQKRSLRGVKFDGKTGRLTEVRLPDAQRAIEQAITLATALQRLAAENETGGVSSELVRAIEAATTKRAQLANRLPPSRVKTIIEGERAA